MWHDGCNSLEQNILTYSSLNRNCASRQRLVLGGLLFLAALVLGWKLPYRGLIYPDEYTLFNYVDWLEHRPDVRTTPLNLICDSIQGNSKPLYILILRIAYWATGGTAATPLFLSALAGLATVLLTYRIGNFVFNKKTAILAAALLAFSPYFLLYARSGFAHMAAAALLAYALLKYLQGCPPGRTGLLLGAAFCAHYSTAIFTVTVVLCEALDTLMTRQWRMAGRRLLRFIGGWWLVPLFFEGSRWLNNLLHPSGTSSTSLIHYWIENAGIAAAMGNPKLGAYGFYLWHLQGPLFCLALLAGFFLLAFPWKSPPAPELRRKFFLLTFFPLAWWSFGPPNGQMMRTLAVAIPYLCLGVAGSLVMLSERGRSAAARFLPGILVAAMIVLYLPQTRAVMRWRSEFTQFLAYNQQHLADCVLVTSQIGTWGLVNPAFLETQRQQLYPEAGETRFVHAERVELIEAAVARVQKQPTHCLIARTNLWRFEKFLENTKRLQTFDSVQAQFPMGVFESQFTAGQWNEMARCISKNATLSGIHPTAFQDLYQMPDVYLYELERTAQ
ncbi:MAG: glycosyltransferase family 39 protein [Candidatus Omnitrophica bacterium]|nr:glycosyltransferase family 39 protein [Candidatus Omnitrophota bacterium]